MKDSTFMNHYMVQFTQPNDYPAEHMDMVIEQQRFQDLMVQDLLQQVHINLSSILPNASNLFELYTRNTPPYLDINSSF